MVESAGVMEGGLVSPTVKGSPQGGPLSPLLSNRMLDVLDRERERREHRFVRYADDCNIYVRSKRAGERAGHGERDEIPCPAAEADGEHRQERVGLSGGAGLSGLQLHDRAAGDRPVQGAGPDTNALYQGRQSGPSRQGVVALLIGWRGYFGFCETPSVLRRLDQWIRRRLRAIVWRQWKRGRSRFAALRRIGIGRVLAAQTTGSAPGPWRLANNPALAIAMPNALFHYQLGLPSLEYRQVA